MMHYCHKNNVFKRYIAYAFMLIARMHVYKKKNMDVDATT